jgi:serine/threonine protein kinase
MATPETPPPDPAPPTVDYRAPTLPAEADAAADARPGDLLGHFRLIEVLGEGGMGIVYRALDESLQRQVALKVVRGSSLAAADSRHVQRLLEEAVAQARLNHPNIVHIYFVGRDRGRPFFAMELVEGPTLAQRLARGPLAFAEVVAVAEQLAGALRHAAKYDIVHGDLKPANVLLATEDAEGGPSRDREGAVRASGTAKNRSLTVAARTVPKIADFGLARRLSEIGDSPAAIAGTPDYLAPEATQGTPLDHRSDLYALGVTLFEITFGRLPYSAAGGLSERLRVHREAPVEFPAPWPMAVPRGWRALLARLLAKNPDDRYADYTALLADLARLRPTAPTAAGRLPRGLAWLVDLMLATMVLQIFYLPLEVFRPFFAEWPVLHVPYALAGGLVLLLASFLQARWRTTPGKRLFHLRIVDGHGLTPGRGVLAARLVVQLLPVWDSVATHVCNAVGLGVLDGFLTGGTWVWILVDLAFALFRRGGRSLHDQLFRTRVVVDAGGI